MADKTQIPTTKPSSTGDPFTGLNFGKSNRLSLWHLTDPNGRDVDINPGQFLRAELGIDLKLLQSQNELMAIKNPEQFLKLRNAEIIGLMGEKGAVTQHFEDVYGKYRDLGLPADVAKKLAVQSADRVLNEQVGILEVAYPGGFAKAFGTASVENKAMYDQSAIALAAVNEYKAKKRAKKIAKKTTKAV